MNIKRPGQIEVLRMPSNAPRIGMDTPAIIRRSAFPNFYFTGKVRPVSVEFKINDPKKDYTGFSVALGDALLRLIEDHGYSADSLAEKPIHHLGTLPDGASLSFERFFYCDSPSGTSIRFFIRRAGSEDRETIAGGIIRFRHNLPSRHKEDIL